MGKGYIYVFVRRKESLLARRLVFTELAKHAEWAEEEVGLYHFRDKRKREADIVLERPHGRIIGVEVKASATVRREDFNGLAALAEFAGARFERGVLFYTGVHVLPFHRGAARFHALPLYRGLYATIAASPTIVERRLPR